MNLSVGIVGLPNVGKSTLFNALRSAQGKRSLAIVANYPFTTIEPNVGVVEVPDRRLEKLAELVVGEDSGQARMTDSIASLANDNLKGPSIVPAVVEFVDIAGLVKGAAQGEGLGNQFLSHIREVDAIIHVLRDFGDDNVVRAGAENPNKDREVVETELQLADLSVAQKLLESIQKDKFNPDTKIITTILQSIVNKLEQGRMAREVEAPERLEGWKKQLPLLTIKPVLYVLNVDEDRIGELGVTGDSGGEMRICAKLEEELADLGEDERMEYLKSVGLEQTGLERLIVEAYKLLGLISFLTAGPKEVRAWTVKSGTRAGQAAGVIHTDFEKNFISVRVVEYEKLIEAGSYGEAKARGWIRTEGRDYVVQDGDVVEFMIGQ